MSPQLLRSKCSDVFIIFFFFFCLREFFFDLKTVWMCTCASCANSGKTLHSQTKEESGKEGRQKEDVTFSSNFPERKKDAQQFEEVLNVHFVPLAKRYFGWSSFQNVLPYVNIQPDRKVYCSSQGKMKGISESWMCDVCVCVCVLEKQYKMVVTVRKVMTNEGKG